MDAPAYALQPGPAAGSGGSSSGDGSTTTSSSRNSRGADVTGLREAQMRAAAARAAALAASATDGATAGLAAFTGRGMPQHSHAHAALMGPSESIGLSSGSGSGSGGGGGGIRAGAYELSHDDDIEGEADDGSVGDLEAEDVSEDEEYGDDEGTNDDDADQQAEEEDGSVGDASMLQMQMPVQRRKPQPAHPLQLPRHTGRQPPPHPLQVHQPQLSAQPAPARPKSSSATAQLALQQQVQQQQQMLQLLQAQQLQQQQAQQQQAQEMQLRLQQYEALLQHQQHQHQQQVQGQQHYADPRTDDSIDSRPSQALPPDAQAGRATVPPAAPQAQPQQELHQFWLNVSTEIEQLHFTPKMLKQSELPLARIKKIMKTDDQVVQMISSEVPLLFSKACEIFIEELAVRAWTHTLDAKRKTIQQSDIQTAVSKSEMYDFLIDIVPQQDPRSARRASATAAASAMGMPAAHASTAAATAGGARWGDALARPGPVPAPPFMFVSPAVDSVRQGLDRWIPPPSSVVTAADLHSDTSRTDAHADMAVMDYAPPTDS